MHTDFGRADLPVSRTRGSASLHLNKREPAPGWKNQRKDAKVPGRKEETTFALRTWRLCAFALNPGQLGREPLQTDVGKIHRRHRAAQRATVRLAAMGSRANRPKSLTT